MRPPPPDSSDVSAKRAGAQATSQGTLRNLDRFLVVSFLPTTLHTLEIRFVHTYIPVSLNSCFGWFLARKKKTLVPRPKLLLIETKIYARPDDQSPCLATTLDENLRTVRPFLSMSERTLYFRPGSHQEYRKTFCFFFDKNKNANRYLRVYAGQFLCNQKKMGLQL